jgi:hypothetical protein
LYVLWIRKFSRNVVTHPPGDIWGSHSGPYGEYGLFGCDTMWYAGKSPIFGSKLLPQSLGHPEGTGCRYVQNCLRDYTVPRLNAATTLQQWFFNKEPWKR